MKELINKIEERFSLCGKRENSDSQVFVIAKKKDVVSLLTHLRDLEGFSHLVFMTAVDFIEEGVFHVVYMLHNYEKHLDLGVKVEIDRDKAEMESIHHLWKQAATYQRELREMFGIDFPGSPRVNETFVLESWNEMPPMRKDFDTKAYSEKTYFPRPGRKTTDPGQHMREKLYPEWRGSLVGDK